MVCAIFFIVCFTISYINSQRVLSSFIWPYWLLKLSQVFESFGGSLSLPVLLIPIGLEMSSCLSGGGRTYGFDLDIVKSTSTSSRTSHSSSPSSTLSESSNSPITILHRKPRTTRKRPNQTYNEAALLLSTAYPKIFPTKHLTKFCKSSKLYSSFVDEPQELLLPFRNIDNSGFLLNQPILEKPIIGVVPKIVNSCGRACQSPQDSDLCGNSSEICDGHQDDFDAESILDEEIEEGIDSIMGNLSVSNDSIIDESTNTTCTGYPLGLGFSGNFDYGFGMRKGGARALRNVDESNWWSFPTVDVVDITPNLKKTPSTATQKKKKKVKKIVELKDLDSPVHNPVAAEEELPELSRGPRLKLNYDKVSKAWSTSDIYVGLSTSTSARKSRSKKVQH